MLIVLMRTATEITGQGLVTWVQRTQENSALYRNPISLSTYVHNGGRFKGEGETPKTSKNTSQRRKTQGPVTYYYLTLPYSNHAARATLGMYLEKKMSPAGMYSAYRYKLAAPRSYFFTSICRANTDPPVTKIWLLASFGV